MSDVIEVQPKDGEGADEPEIDREALEREAGQARARLLHRIDVLERRRHEVMDVKHQVETHIVPVAASGAIVVAGAGAVLALVINHAIDSRRHRGRERMRAFQRIWQHPERAGRYQPRSAFAEIGRKVLVAAASFVAVELTKRGVRRIMDLRLQAQSVQTQVVQP